MKKYDSIIIVPDEGYSTNIYDKAVEIYKELMADKRVPVILVSGATRNPKAQKAYGLKKILERFLTIIPVQAQIERMKMRGIPAEDIFYESLSMHTRENAMNSFKAMQVMNVCVKHIYLIGSLEGMLRRYLTFKKATEDLKLNFSIKTVSVFNLFPIKLTIARLLLVPGEFFRIWKYHKLGHI